MGNRSLPTIGFGESRNEAKRPTPDELVQTLPREIVNRFSRDLQILEPLRQSDYESMLAAIAPRVPSYLRETFLQLGRESATEAMKMQQDCRFIEDIMLQTILSERASLQIIQLEFQENEKKDAPVEENEMRL